MEQDEIPTIENQSNKQSKNGAGKRLKDGAKKLLNNKKIKQIILAHIPLIVTIILIVLAILFFMGIILFIITMPGLIIGSIEEFGRNLLGNLQGIFTGDSTTAKISSEEIVDLAQHLQAMGYDIQGYGLGSVKYEDDGQTVNTRNGKAKKIEEVTESVDGKHYLRSYIAANENTYVLSEYSVGGALRSIGNNVATGAVELINLIPFVNISTDDLKLTSAEDYSTGMINIVGQTDGSIFESKNAKDYVSIDRDTKQMKIYSTALAHPGFGFLGILPGFNLADAFISGIKRVVTGDDKIQLGETFSYDLNNWVGRYGRPTELFLALHLSTMMPDLTYEIATSQDFNTKVNMGLLDASVQFTPTATKGDETIDSIDIMKLFLKECVGKTDVDSLDETMLETEFRNTTNNIVAVGTLRVDEEKIPGTEFTRAEIAELAAITHVGKNKSAGGSATDSLSFNAVGQDNGNFIKYNLSEKQLSQLTYVAYREQGSDQGAAAEASLIANLFEIKKNKNGNADELVNYVLYGGWFASQNTGSEDNDEHHKDIVRQVLVNGKRTLPIYVDEHDCFSDINSSTNNGSAINVSDRSAYVKDTTVISNRYGSTYTFYSFPAEGSDPFGYHNKFGSDFHYEMGSSKATASNATTAYGNISEGVPFVTGVNISRDDFIKECTSYKPQSEFVQYAGVIYDVCVNNNINPIFCAAQAMQEQSWNSPSGASGNFWGLGVFNGMQTSIYGAMPVEEYTQKWCDNIKQRLKGELGVLETSQLFMHYNSHFTGGINTIYDVLDNYAAPNNSTGPKSEADFTVDYIDNNLLVCAKNIFGEDKVDLFNTYSINTGNGINIKWPFIASVTNHWYYEDIDFTKNVYRFAKAATKTMDYKPDDEKNVLNKNNVSVKLDAEITSDMGVIYQVAEPEAVGPNKNIIRIFSDKYYRYNGSTDRAFKVEMKKAQDLYKSRFKFNGEEYSVDKQETEKIEKEEVSFKENKTESLAAFGILDNMHTEASDYIYRDLKELMVSLKHFSTAEFTEDLKAMMLWPIETENNNSVWETKLDPEHFGTTIKCNDQEETVLAPSDAVIKEIDGNSVTLKFTTLNKEATELLEYIYSYKDSFKKINRDLVTGLEFTIDNIQLDGKIKKGAKVKRGAKLGKAIGETDGKKSITVTMYQLDKSIIENISEYIRQEENNKYEEIMKTRKEAPTQYKEGIDIYDYVNGRQREQEHSPAQPTNEDIKDAGEKALEKRGAKWVLSGYDEAKNEFSSSGLVEYAFDYSSNTYSPETLCEEVRNKGNLIDYNSSGRLNDFTDRLKYGDLVFFKYQGRYPGHVGIYIGDGKIIHSSGNEGVHVETLESVNQKYPVISGGTFKE